jgi:hypothetical protein
VHQIAVELGNVHDVCDGEVVDNVVVKENTIAIPRESWWTVGIPLTRSQIGSICRTRAQGGIKLRKLYGVL